MARHKDVRGPASQLASVILQDGERVWDTTLKRERRGDGSTVGGLIALAEDDLDGLGFVDVNQQSQITGSVTIPNNFPAAYAVSDSGTPADYNIFMPAGAAVGSIVYFRFKPTATKLFTLYDSGTDMEGVDRMIFQGGETVMLLKEATGWKRIGGTPLPIRGAIKRVATQTDLTSNVFAAVNFTTLCASRRNFGHGFDSVNGKFIAPRTGDYQFTATIPLTGITADALADAGFTVAGAVDPEASPQSYARSTETGGSRSLHLSTQLYVGRGVNVGVSVRGVGSPVIDYVANIIEATMSWQEIVN